MWSIQKPKAQNIKVIRWWKTYQFQVRLYPIRLVSDLNKLAKTTRISSNVFQKQYLIYWLFYSDNIKNWWNCIWILYSKLTYRLHFTNGHLLKLKCMDLTFTDTPAIKGIWMQMCICELHIIKVCTTTNECIALIYAICATSEGEAPHVCTGIG